MPTQVSPTRAASRTPPAGKVTSFPSAATTGVPAGTTLTPYTGPSTITATGTVIDAKRITTCLVVKANNVTITNSSFASVCSFNILSDSGATDLRIADVEIDGLADPASDSAVAGSNYACLRCNIHGTTDGFKAGTNVVIDSSYIHDLTLTSDSHNDGVQSLGTTNLYVAHNTIVLADGATAAVILSTGSAPVMTNVTITGNLLGGGAFTVYGGYSADEDSLEKVGNISITDNHFSTKTFPRGGAYGPLTSTDPPVRVSGNTWYDGPQAGDPVQ